MGKLKDIDPEEVRELAKIGCTYEEMAGVLRCNKDTLTSRFKDIIHEGWEEGKRSIRRKQMEVAMSGDRTMLIWLGKQMGQSDRVRSDITSGGDKIAPLTINVTSPEAAEALKAISEGK